MNPVRFRAFLYFTLAVLPVWGVWFTDAGKQLLEGKQPLIHWIIFTGLAINSLYQGFLALRAYYDGTAERAKAQQDNKANEGNKTA